MLGQVLGLEHQDAGAGVVGACSAAAERARRDEGLDALKIEAHRVIEWVL